MCKPPISQLVGDLGYFFSILLECSISEADLVTKEMLPVITKIKKQKELLRET